MKTIENLVNFLKRCDDAYYNTSEVLVTNDTYDSMVRTLRKLDPNNSYLSKVGANISDESIKVGRVTPMGTLSKYHTEEEVKKWLDSEVNEEIILAPKYDGFGVELIYNDGNFVMASTRGDGHTGENVTSAIMRINNIPLILPDEFKSLEIVRGEVIIPRINHDKVKELGYTAMRNAIPGIVRSNRWEGLLFSDFIAYEFFDGTNDRVLQREKYKDLFNVEMFSVYNSSDFDLILANRNAYGKVKDNYKYEIDGTVLKTRIIKEDDYLNPIHQIAWKFKSNRRETILRGIDFQLGVTGKFTPIGIFDEVEFQGAKLTRASLGSMDRYYELKPCIGDTIEVSRRGDIIPYIENIISHNLETTFNYLEVCPHCGKALVDNECVNTECPEKLRLQIINYVGSIGVKGIGQGLVSKLIENKYIAKLSDIYKVTREQILSMPRQGESSASKYETLINKEITLVEFLSALPFDSLGIKFWKDLTSKCDFDTIMTISYNEIHSLNLKGIGDSKINMFIKQRDLYKEEIIKMYNLANIK